VGAGEIILAGMLSSVCLLRLHGGGALMNPDFQFHKTDVALQTRDESDSFARL